MASDSVVSVVILSSRSLFVEGIATRLQQYPNRVKVQVISPTEKTLLTQTKTIRPDTVILDANDIPALELCPLSELVFANPPVQVMRLSTQDNQIQVLTTQTITVGDVQDLIDIMEWETPTK